MKILHILNDGPTPLSTSVIGVQSRENEVKVVDLSQKSPLYEKIVDDIFSCERVVSW